MSTLDLTHWDIITEEDFQGMQFDSGVLIKNFDPTTFVTPAEGDIACVTSGDFSLTYNHTKVNLGDDVNNIFFRYAELEVITGTDAATLTVTTLDFSAEGIKRALGAADISDTKVTPRFYIQPSDFENIAWVGMKLGGGLVAVVIPKALSTGGISITATKGGKGRNQLTIQGFKTINDKSKAEMEFYSTSGSGITITAQPVDVETNAGTAAAFSVTATGTSTLSYQWQLCAVGDTTYHDISGETTDELELATTDVVAAADGNKYRCKITMGTTSVYTKPALLTVNTGA